MSVPSDIARKYRSVVLAALSQLKKGDARPKTLHRLRTHLRRLQAYAELVGECANAKTMGDCVSHFSPLRTLDVFESYLVRHQASKADLRIVRKRIKAKRRNLRRKKVVQRVEKLVLLHAVPPVPALDQWLPIRMRRLRELNTRELRDLAGQAAADPCRKTLHLLRLNIKAVRYQEEWVLHQTHGRSDMAAWLKRAQQILGEYEEYGQFRKLRRKWELDLQDPLEKDWTRARKRAHAIPRQLLKRFPAAAERRLHLVAGHTSASRSSAKAS